jgi:hypothetical protein
MTNRQQIEAAVRDTLLRLFGPDDTFAVVGVDSSDNLKLTLLGLTLDDAGEITRKATR